MQREQSHDHWKRSSKMRLSSSRGAGATSAAARETVTSLASKTTAAHSAWAGFWLLSNDWRKHRASNALRAILVDIMQAQPSLYFFLYFLVYFDPFHLCNVLKYTLKYTHAVQKEQFRTHMGSILIWTTQDSVHGQRIPTVPWTAYRVYVVTAERQLMRTQSLDSYV
jgi:sensor histidine kinase YesM